tara:strand:- start:416 stop:775 length:360 start_codon:yes stop_codon:yes gene_type:complete
MSKDEKKEKIFSIERDYLELVLDDADEQLRLTSAYLSHYLEDPNTSSFLLSMLCENYAANYGLKLESKKCLEFNEIIQKDKKDLVILTQSNMSILETSAFSRYLVVSQLNDQGISVFFN